jgi:hypothetical protein
MYNASCRWRCYFQSLKEAQHEITNHTSHLTGVICCWFSQKLIEVMKTTSVLTPNTGEKVWYNATKMADAVKFLIRIREMPSSNLGQDARYPNWSFLLFSSVPDECQNSSWKQITTVTFHILSNSSFINHPTISCHVACASLHKPHCR